MSIFGILKAAGAAKNSAKTAKYEYKKAKLETKSQDKIEKEKNRLAPAKSAIEYIRVNANSVREFLVNFLNETTSLVADLEQTKNSRKLQSQVKENLSYLYLSKTFIELAFDLEKDVNLTNKQISFICKFKDFYSGTRVNLEESESDSAIGMFKETIKDMFTSGNTIYDELLSSYKKQIADKNVFNIVEQFDSFMQSKSNQSVSSKNDQTGIVAIIEKQRFCEECGAKVSGSAKFCPECGHKL